MVKTTLNSNYLPVNRVRHIRPHFKWIIVNIRMHDLPRFSRVLPRNNPEKEEHANEMFKEGKWPSNNFMSQERIERRGTCSLQSRTG